MRTALAGLLVASVTALTPFAAAADWTYWRGPSMQGVSDETDLIDDWSPEGDTIGVSAREICAQPAKAQGAQPAAEKVEAQKRSVSC